MDYKVGLKPEELRDIIPKYEGLVVRSATKVTLDIISNASNLKVVGRAGVGVDNIDIPEATKHGVLVMNTPGGNTVSTAQLAISLLCAAARSIPQADMTMKQGKWARSDFKGIEMSGKTLAIVGCGRIGQEVARWAKAMNMRVIGFDPVLSVAQAKERGIELFSDINDIWQLADFVTLHTPLTDTTRNLVNDAAIDACKDGVIFVNCARGGIIDEDALLRGLESGKVGAAALDVYPVEPPPESSRALLNHPRMVCTPHLGASTDEAQINVARDIALQMCDMLEGKGFQGVLNARHLALTTNKAMLPFMNLGELVGKLVAQLGSAPIKKIEVSTWGGKDISISSPDARELILAMVQKGVLMHTASCPSTPNLVSAPYLAKTLSVESVISEDLPSLVGLPYRNLVTVNATTQDDVDIVVSGSVFGTEPHIVQIDEHQNFPALKPTKHLLSLNNEDKPGELAKILSVLEKHQVNVARMSISRQSDSDNSAFYLISCDQGVPLQAIAEIGTLGASGVTCCKL